MLKRIRECNANKTWPKDCIWPEPLYDGFGPSWDEDIIETTELDSDGEDLLAVKAYFDSLVENGVLDEDYQPIEDFDIRGDSEKDKPYLAIDYWDDGFLYDVWHEDMTSHMNFLKLDTVSAADDPVSNICRTIGYDFANENLLRQAFTRRAFAIEHKLSGNNEELEFLGDSVLGNIVTREIFRQLAEVETITTDAPLQTKYDEGDFTKIRSSFVSKEYLAKRAETLGLDKYILYGKGEESTESSKEDAIEALIGAVALDSEYNEKILEEVIDKLVCIQLGSPGLLLKETFYDMFNSWHQKHFGRIPEYTVYGKGPYRCTVRFFVPENGIGVNMDQRMDMDGATRSEARELAAEFAYRFIYSKGLWINLKDAGVVPDLENSINQLQELYQKKYLDEKPVYEIKEDGRDRWRCVCECCGVSGFGTAESKTKAKKKASFMALVKLLDGAGCCKEEWLSEMYRML